MAEPVVVWYGSLVAWKTGDGLHVVWALNPAEVAPVAPKPKAKRGR